MGYVPALKARIVNGRGLVCQDVIRFYELRIEEETAVEPARPEGYSL